MKKNLNALANLLFGIITVLLALINAKRIVLKQFLVYDTSTFIPTAEYSEGFVNAFKIIIYVLIAVAIALVVWNHNISKKFGGVVRAGIFISDIVEIISIFAGVTVIFGIINIFGGILIFLPAKEKE